MADFDVKIRISAVDLVKGVARGVQASVNKVTSSVKKLDAAGQKLRATGQQFTAAGAGMAKVGAVVAAPLALATKSFASFETGIARIATLGNDTVPQAMAKLGESVKNLSVESGQKIGILNDALFDAQSAGFKGAEGLNIMRAATISATGGFTDVNKVLPAITKSLLAYGQNGFQAGKLIEQLAISNELGVLTIEELSASLPNIAASAAQLNIPMSQLLGTVTGMSTQSKSVTNAINNLNAALAGISTPTAEAVKMVKELNKNLPTDKQFEFDTAALMRKGLVPFFQELEKVTGGSKIAIDKLFGSIEARRGVGALLGSMNIITKATERNMGATNEAILANKNMKKALSTLQGQLNKIIARFKVLSINIGQKLVPVVKKLFGIFDSMVGVVESLVDRYPKLTSAVLTLSAAFAGIALLGGGTLIFLGQVFSSVGNLIPVITKLGGAIGLAGKAGLVGSLISLAVPLAAIALAAAPIILLFKHFNDVIEEQIELGKKVDATPITNQFEAAADAAKLFGSTADKAITKVADTTAKIIPKIELVKPFGGKDIAPLTPITATADVLATANLKQFKVTGDVAVKQMADINKDLVSQSKDAQDKITSNLQTNLDKRLAALKSSVKAVQGLEAGTFGITTLNESQKRLLFGGTEAPESGSASRGLESSFVSALLSASEGKQAGQVINIENIELPAVNAGQFVEDMAEIGGGRKG